MLRAVIFDFDFTLGDTSSGILKCVSLAFKELGLPIPPEDRILRTIGLPLDDCFAELAGPAGAGLAGQFATRFATQSPRLVESSAVLYPAVPWVLGTLRNSGLKTAIASMKDRQRVLNILARHGLVGAIDVVVGGDSAASCNDSPSAVGIAMDLLRVSAEEAIYVGDHPANALAAQDAGIAFIAVLTGRHTIKDFNSVGISAILGSVAELPEWLQNHRATRRLNR